MRRGVIGNRGLARTRSYGSNRLTPALGNTSLTSIAVTENAEPTTTCQTSSHAVTTLAICYRTYPLVLPCGTMDYIRGVPTPRGLIPGKSSSRSAHTFPPDFSPLHNPKKVMDPGELSRRLLHRPTGWTRGFPANLEFFLTFTWRRPDALGILHPEDMMRNI